MTLHSPALEPGADCNPRERNAATVRTFLRLLEEGNIPAWSELWSPDGRQDMPYAPPGFPSSLVGRDRLAEHFSGLPLTFEVMRFPDLVLHPTVDPNVVIAEFRGDIKLKGRGGKYDNRYINVFRFDEAGLISRVVEYFNPLVLTDAGAFAEDSTPRGAVKAASAASDATRPTAWVREFFTTVDSRNADRIAASFTEDVRLAFGNRPMIEGREAARASFAATAGALKGVRHDLTGVWRGLDGETPVLSVEAQVTYTLPDDREVTVPCTSTLRLRDQLIADYRIFIDTTPVFGPA